jgi:hypothetical protein
MSITVSESYVECGWSGRDPAENIVDSRFAQVGEPNGRRPISHRFEIVDQVGNPLGAGHFVRADCVGKAIPTDVANDSDLGVAAAHDLEDVITRRPKIPGSRGQLRLEVLRRP